ncbi:hypothetical protein ACPPVT_05710 [Angustibacter sp. McL0619]|uniref:hypothetical protein n=1 Tax=Angustibacter sp. McL0619 TaxID=3415676 RepID=UPI003CF79349
MRAAGFAGTAVRAWAARASAVRRSVAERVRTATGAPPDRGDVPGWVLVTIMTAGLVAALWAVAGPTLNDLFVNSINSVAP